MSVEIFISSKTTIPMTSSLKCRYNGEVGDVVVGRIIEVCIQPVAVLLHTRSIPIFCVLYFSGSTEKVEG